MKIKFIMLFCLNCIILMSFNISAMNNSYPIGVEGLGAASCPPPGLYYKMYTQVYSADDLRDDNGNKISINFNLNVMANAHRLLYVTRSRLFGADYAMDIIVPALHLDAEIGSSSLNTTALGDITIEPLILSWHKPFNDITFAAGMIARTGKFNTNDIVSAGDGYNSLLLSFGTTQYWGYQKDWSASILARYEFHGTQKYTQRDYGDVLLAEWGIGKKLNKVWEAGLSGYCQWQTSKDNFNSSKDRVYSIGPEIKKFVPMYRMFLSIRILFELGVNDRSEGNNYNFVLTKMF